MYTIMPWMFDMCNGNHKLTCVFAFIFSCCQGGQSFVCDEDAINQICDYCRVTKDSVLGLLSDLVTLGAIQNTELGYVINI